MHKKIAKRDFEGTDVRQSFSGPLEIEKCWFVGCIGNPLVNINDRCVITDVSIKNCETAGPSVMNSILRRIDISDIKTPKSDL